MKDAILVLNTGSSSVKFFVFIVDSDALRSELRGQLDGLFTSPRFVARNAIDKVVALPLDSQQISPCEIDAFEVRGKARAGQLGSGETATQEPALHESASEVTVCEVAIYMPQSHPTVRERIWVPGSRNH
jgi:hypothetical protein